MPHHDYSVTEYLEALAALCLEVSQQPQLLPTFVEIIELVPRLSRS